MREEVEAGAEQHSSSAQHSTAAPGRGDFDVALARAQTKTPAMAVSSREKAGQRATCPARSLPLETHWRASAVLSTASSAAGTKRTRSCSSAALPPAGG
jgi:hypothetical protein